MSDATREQSILPKTVKLQLEMCSLSATERDVRVESMEQLAVLINQPLSSTAVYLMHDFATDAVSFTPFLVFTLLDFDQEGDSQGQAVH
jgi:hypothetical protein